MNDLTRERDNGHRKAEAAFKRKHELCVEYLARAEKAEAALFEARSDGIALKDEAAALIVERDELNLAVDLGDTKIATLTAEVKRFKCMDALGITEHDIAAPRPDYDGPAPSDAGDRARAVEIVRVTTERDALRGRVEKLEVMLRDYATRSMTLL